MHFTEGLPHSNWKKLDFDHHGNVYTVTGVVQYTNNPDHFIAWLRNPTGNLVLFIFMPRHLPSEIFSVHLSIHQHIQHSCPLHTSDTIRDIFMKFHTNVKYFETTCKTYELLLWFAYFWSSVPLNIEHSHFYHVLMSALKLKKRSRYNHEISLKCKAP